MNRSTLVLVRAASRPRPGRASTCALVVIFLAWTATSAAIDGGIVAPVDGACFGPEASPVVVEDDFDAGFGIDLRKDYDPAPWSVDRIVTDRVEDQGRLGGSVALDGSLALLGAPRNDRYGLDRTGSAFAARYGVEGWIVEDEFPPIELRPYGYFGTSVALDGPWAVVGHPQWTQSRLHDGVVGLYRRGGDGGWSDPRWFVSRGSATGHGRFGASVAIEDGRIVVGAPGESLGGGRAYVYVPDSGRWVATLRADDSPYQGQFGSAVAVAGDRILVGARFHPEPVPYAGAAYVFHQYAHDRYRLEAKLASPDPQRSEYFGDAVATDGEIAVVGAPAFEAYGLVGTAHVFRRAGAQWHHEASLSAPGVDRNDSFGRAVAIHDGSVWVGAPSTDSGDFRLGAVFEFRRVDGTWAPVRRLTAQDSGIHFGFGQAISADDGNLAIGVPGDRESDDIPGSAYVFRRGQPSDEPRYRLHGDHHVRVFARAPDGRVAEDDVRFTLDLIPPRVEILRPYRHEVLVADTPFDIVFEASDDDLATGGVIGEDVRLNGCTIYDGNHYGDRDGLLRDETLRVDEAQRCRIARECGFDVLEDVVIEVRAFDCGGNVRTDRVDRRGGPLRLRTEGCD